MPKLKPLQQWICDGCGRAMSVDEACLVWRLRTPSCTRPHDFRILHNNDACDTRPLDECLGYQLGSFTGIAGLQYLLAMIDPGPLHAPEIEHLPPLPERRSLVDTMRRLYLPYYEEARRHFDAARRDRAFASHDAESIFVPEACQAIIERYG